MSTANVSSGTTPAILSVEQKRRRAGNSALPKEHYELAVLRHQLTDPDTDEVIPCRVIFVFSSADQKVCQAERERSIAKIRAGLEKIAQSVARGHTAWHDPVQHPSPRRQTLRRTRQPPATSAGNSCRSRRREQAALPPPGAVAAARRIALFSTSTKPPPRLDANDDGYSALLDDRPVHAQCRHAVHRVQAAVLRRASSSPVEDAAGGPAALPQIAGAGRGSRLLAQDRPDRLSPRAASVSSSGCPTTRRSPKNA